MNKYRLINNSTSKKELTFLADIFSNFALVHAKLRDVLNSTYNILPLSGLATLTGQRTLTVFEEPVSGKVVN